MDRRIVISYDHEADVMYLTFDESAKAVAKEIDEGIFARYKPKDRSLAGLTITNFSKKFGREPKGVAVPVYGERD